MTRTTLLHPSLVVVLLFVFSCGVEAQDLNQASRVEVGAQFSTLPLGARHTAHFRIVDFVALPFSQSESGIGGRVTWNLAQSVALENEANFFPRGQSAGGHALQLQSGVKAGHRFKRIGVFAKARPGFVSFSKFATEDGIDTIGNPPLQFNVPHIESRRRYFFSMDVGAVFELYLSRKLLVRVDGGDTIIRYGKGLFFDLDENTPQLPSQTNHVFQFSAGVGFRL